MILLQHKLLPPLYTCWTLVACMIADSVLIKVSRHYVVHQRQNTTLIYWFCVLLSYRYTRVNFPNRCFAEPEIWIWVRAPLSACHWSNLLSGEISQNGKWWHAEVMQSPLSNHYLKFVVTPEPIDHSVAYWEDRWMLYNHQRANRN